MGLNMVPVLISYFDPLPCEAGRVCLRSTYRHGIDCAPAAMVRRDAAIKRVMDIVFALALLMLLAIPMLLVAAAIRLTSPGPAMFSQERIGLHGRRFRMLKFR